MTVNDEPAAIAAARAIERAANEEEARGGRVKAFQMRDFAVTLRMCQQQAEEERKA